MRVIGVDPGLVRTGWAAIESLNGEYHLLAAGLIAPRATEDLTSRLAEGFRQFSSVLTELQPDAMFLEDVFSAPQHPRAALLMAHMRGVLCLAAGQLGVPVDPMTATTVKQRVTGNGHASKTQVREMVFRLCGISEGKMRADVTDAIALAVAGLNQIERGRPLVGGGRTQA